MERNRNIEKKLGGLTPLKLSQQAKTRILREMRREEARKPGFLTRTAQGFITAAMPVGIAAMFLAAAGIHFCLPPDTSDGRVVVHTVAGADATNTQQLASDVLAGANKTAINSVIISVAVPTNALNLLN